MHFLFAAFVSGSLAVGPQAGSDWGPKDRAFAQRLSRVVLTEQKVERMAVAAESFAQRQLDAFPGLPIEDDLDGQLRTMTTPVYAKTLRIVGLTAREYVEGVQAIALLCSGWVDKKEVDLYFRKQVNFCDARPQLIKRFLK